MFFSVILFALIFKQEIKFVPIIIYGKDEYSWFEIFLIYFVDYPRLVIFLNAYQYLNNRLKIKNIDAIIKKYIFTKLIGFSYNTFIKLFYNYRIIKKSIQNVN